MPAMPAPPPASEIAAPTAAGEIAAAPAAALALARLSAPEVDPFALLRAIPATRRHVFWRGPGETAVVGVGAAAAATSCTGPGEDPSLVRLAADLGAEIAAGLGAPAPADLPIFFAVAFDPPHAFAVRAGGAEEPQEAERWRGYSPVELLVPEIVVRCAAGGTRIVLLGAAERLAALREEAEDLLARAAAAPRVAFAPPADLAIEWAEAEHRENVAAALEALADPELSKVVLAHAVEVFADRALDPGALLAALEAAHPRCFLFSLRPAAGAAVFLGASPERLARVAADGAAQGATEGAAETGARVSSGALAGSAPRGGTDDEDAALGRRLLESAKDRQEHAIVGDMIVAALAPLSRRVERADAPELARFRNVQHLYTPISGELLPGRTLLDAVSALHPTPAVGGMPRERALAAIRRLESRPRGLYAGVVGWTGADGGGTGDSAVAIRSALVDGRRALLFAGGGIVPTSQPDVELEETRLKLAAILGVMTPPGDRGSRRE